MGFGWHSSTALVLLLPHLAMGIITMNMVFAKIYSGSQKIAGSYTSVGIATLASCSGTCIATPQCYVFTWDKKSSLCSLMDPLTSIPRIGSAPSTLQSYSINSIGGKELKRTPTKGTWTNTKLACEAMGGRLYLPPNENMMNLFHSTLGESTYWLGMYRESSNRIWRNMDGEPVTDFLPWYPWEPNYMSGQLYIASWDGGMSDLADVNSYGTFYGMCEV